jgi:hypothetical protein
MRMQDALAARAGAVVPAIAPAGSTEDREGDLAGAFPAGAKAVIHCPAPSAASSARARRPVWVLAFEPRAPLSVEPLMGWTSGTDMLRHVRLRFPSREVAVAYAERHGLAYEVREPAHLPRPVIEAGSDEAWTLPPAVAWAWDAPHLAAETLSVASHSLQPVAQELVATACKPTPAVGTQS